VLRPAVVVDLKRLQDLRYVSYDDAMLRIGALTRHVDVERLHDRDTLTWYPILPELARLIGDLPIRTRGTVGGSIAHADPRSEWCVLSVLLDAEVIVAVPAGHRAIRAGDFFTGVHRSVLGDDELVVELRFAAPAPSAALVEFTLRDGDMALVVAAAAVTLNMSGRIAAARIALGGVAERPVRLRRAEAAILGKTPGSGLLEDVRRAVSEEIDPPTDFRAEGAYRKDLAVSLVARALSSSLAKCGIVAAEAGADETLRDAASPGGIDGPDRGDDGFTFRSRVARPLSEHVGSNGKPTGEEGETALLVASPPAHAVPVELTVNGQLFALPELEPCRSLADVLRRDLGLVGCRLGCEMGVCGSCTVLLDGEPVRSCVMLGVQAGGAEIETVESLAENGQLGELQRAFSEKHALQCGFCTPGFLMLATALLRDEPSPTRERIREYLSANLCRCTGYAGIIDAVALVAKAHAEVGP
jgi:xanthine dehydrogenase iron-sulfur cluster and FAD-binding subunit A